MKKDIEIPVVKDVYLVVVPEYNDVFKTDDWNVYIVNNKEVDLEMLLINSKGFDGDKETAKMKHKIDLLPAKSGVKFELMVDEVLVLNNEFKVTFFENNKLYYKVFLLKKGSIKKSALRLVKALGKRGHIIK